MRRIQDLFRRYGSFLILVGTVALIVWWVSITFASGSQNGARGQESESSLMGVDLGTLLESQQAPDSQNGENDLPPTNIDMASVPVLQDVSFSPRLDPFTYEGPRPAVTYTTYLVEVGDTPNSIADQFGLEASTLLGGNPRLSDESSLLQAGDEIIILPIDGVLHQVRRGDTLELLAEEWGVPAEEIIAYEPNNLEFPYRLYEGTELLIPGAVREVFVWTPPTLSSSGSSSGGFGVQPAIVGTGTFVWPVTGRRITQYFHAFHRGVDIAMAEGSAVYASDTGTVIWASWNNTGYGNLIVIDHGNGFQSYYGHLSGYEVYAGQIVYQGNIIGYSGNTGRSSGPHVHFEIRRDGAQQDPFWAGYLP